ncbi:MAG TPA: GTPase ObgE [Anaerolineae bacterium]|nr:GTPase ObgE [Anaerolineae bacterium]HOQ99900.1 GTPase ObgE [Anaerolineae bacterium]HPL30290.1 GTPase ObgE [Anaerolineae bacterium]
MQQGLFFDEARIYVRSGDGGSGCVSFRREKYVPYGGPNGGNGGAGGDVYLVATAHVTTLIEFKRRSHFRAERGVHGGSKDKQGARGANLEIPVPVGTIVRDAEGNVLGDLVENGQRLLVARGGRGGRGNASFATATNQAPRTAENGEPGHEHWLQLELRLLADVGIVGMPNAGKSTLLAAVSAARPKIADYPFTTLVPNLGVAEVDRQALVLADIPGLIEGAHAGAGLGTSFLRHIERTRVIIHLLNGLADDPLADWHQINQELQLFDAELARKPQVVAVNKMDVPEVRERWPELRLALEAAGAEAMAISAVTGEGTRDLLRRVAVLLAAAPPPAPVEAVPVLRPHERPEEAIRVRREPDGAYRLEGERIERAAAMTPWGNEEAVDRFQRILRASGAQRALEEAGVASGDTVRIGNVELEWE